jgi:hypothetical protein
MTPLIKEMVKVVLDADLDPTQMQWFDMSESLKEWVEFSQRKYLLHPAPYKNMMLCGRLKQQGTFMLSVLTEQKTAIVTGWILRPTGYDQLGSFLIAEHNGEPKTGEVDGPINPQNQSTMCAILAMFYASLDTRVQAYVPTPHKANVSRAKRGLTPLYDWRTIVIEPSQVKQKPQGGTHASPRRHQARGHWRTYQSGKRGWVRECFRGDASKGAVFKDYQIKENA